MIRATFNSTTQSFKEICEHCGEEVSTLHISDIIQKPNNNNGLTLRIKDKDNRLVEIKDPQKIITEVSESYISKGLLDEAEARTAFRSKKMKYGLRPEAMCSQSIDTVTGITSSFCYKTDHPRFLAKYSASFHTGSQVATNSSGSKVGVDRKGNIIRMKSEKNLDEADSAVKYHGQFKESWFRALKPDIQKSYLEKVQDCSVIQKQFGADACKSGEVMSQFRNVDEFKTYMDRNCR